MSPPVRTYTKISEATWELVRAAYLSGLSAPVVARRFGVTVPALRKRAARDGWTKAALAHAQTPPAKPAPVAPPPALPLAPEAIARTALEEATRALAEGRPYAARACAAAGDLMARLADRVPGYSEAESIHAINARHDYWMGAVEEVALDLAGKLARGEPLGAHFAALEARWRAQQAQAAA